MDTDGEVSPRDSATTVQGGEGQADQGRRERGVLRTRATEDAEMRRRSPPWQRARILDAVVNVVAERGVAGASVELVCTRAKVSRRTFYECFDGLDRCLVAVLDGALARAAPLVVGAFATEDSWQDGMRSALAAMLAFFDEEPALARVCLLELLTAAPVVREHRERILAAFAALVLARVESEVSHASPLAAEGTYASVVGIVNARLVGSGQPPLIELLGPLMGIIVGPFMDQAQVAREVQRGDELARELLARRSSEAEHRIDMSVSVPDVLLTARGHRARLCLLYVAEQGERGLSPSSQQVAVGIGLSRRRQVWGSLEKLAALGLLVKHVGGAGYPNAWSLTLMGERVALALAEQP
jgi:AcrR family transcriptional regulator